MCSSRTLSEHYGVNGWVGLGLLGMGWAGQVGRLMSVCVGVWMGLA